MDYMKLISLLKRSKFGTIFVFFLFYSYNGITQDLRSAYLQVKWVIGFTYSADLYLFTNLPNTAFRPYVLIGWGIGTDTLKFIDATSDNNIVRSKYSGKCVYGGPSIYNVNIYENFRINGIKNIVNSQNEPIQFINRVVVNSFGPANSAPLFQSPPIYFSRIGNQVFYDPKFIDPDGDSLSYSLVNCSVSSYYLPNGVTLSQTGVLSFSKDSIGNYAFSYKIEEWRKDSGGNYNYTGTSFFDFVMDINSSIGINEVNNANKMHIYPNPVLNTLHIESEQYFGAGSAIEITNALGQTVLKLPYNNEIDVSNISNGCYFLKIIRSNNETFHSKFIKE